MSDSFDIEEAFRGNDGGNTCAENGLPHSGLVETRVLVRVGEEIRDAIVFVRPPGLTVLPRPVLTFSGWGEPPEAIPWCSEHGTPHSGEVFIVVSLHTVGPSGALEPRRLEVVGWLKDSPGPPLNEPLPDPGPPWNRCREYGVPHSGETYIDVDVCVEDETESGFSSMAMTLQGWFI